ncbi:MAG: hypothetical protein Q4G05_06265 [Clostridia bacterium]|nr:hypothetical protein [Clostridia bacterium]
MKTTNLSEVSQKIIKPDDYARTCRCASLCQGPGVNCKGCKEQHASVEELKEVYWKTRLK